MYEYIHSHFCAFSCTIKLIQQGLKMYVVRLYRLSIIQLNIFFKFPVECYWFDNLIYKAIPNTMYPARILWKVNWLAECVVRDVGQPPWATTIELVATKTEKVHVVLQYFQRRRFIIIESIKGMRAGQAHAQWYRSTDDDNCLYGWKVYTFYFVKGIG